MALKKAVKNESKLRMALIGPAGSGKTFSALSIAKYIANGKPIALFDTEHGSASKYSDYFDFDTDDIVAPFHPDKFCKAIQDAVDGGYGVVIIDSMSHAWNGEGGVLDLVEMFAKRMKNPNSFAAWKDVTPIQNRLTEAVLSANIHVIVTMRSKTEYVLQDDGKGKQTPRKVGMAPIQKENWDYEFDIVFEMDPENNAIVTKSRCLELSNRLFAKPGKDVAAIITKWLSGAQPTEPPKQPAPKPQPEAQHRGAQAPAPTPAQPVTTVTTEGATGMIAKIIAENNLTSPGNTKAWAVKAGYCDNDHHATGRWAKVVKDNKLNPSDMATVIPAFIERCFAEGIAQPEPVQA